MEISITIRVFWENGGLSTLTFPAPGPLPSNFSHLPATYLKKNISWGTVIRGAWRMCARPPICGGPPGESQRLADFHVSIMMKWRGCLERVLPWGDLWTPKGHCASLRDDLGGTCWSPWLCMSLDAVGQRGSDSLCLWGWSTTLQLCGEETSAWHLSCRR